MRQRELPLCNQPWWRHARDSLRSMAPPAAGLAAVPRARLDRVKALRAARGAPGETFDHNGFVWRNPARFNDTQLRQHYAQVARQPGVRAGFIEACALAEAADVRITLWQVHRTWKLGGAGYGELLGDFGGVDAEGARVATTPHVAIGVIGETHYRALLPHTHKPCFHETEAGGMGDCLFYAVRRALQRIGGRRAAWSARVLREMAADRITRDARYDERVRSASEQAFCEYGA